MINDHGDVEDEDGDDDDDDEGDDDDDGVDDNDENDVNYNVHVFGLYKMRTCLAYTKCVRIVLY